MPPVNTLAKPGFPPERSQALQYSFSLGKMGIAIGPAAAVRQPLNAAFLVAIEDFIAGLAGDSALPAEFRHRSAGELQTAAFRPSPNTPSTASLPPSKKGKSVTHVSGTICYLRLGSLIGGRLWI